MRVRATDPGAASEQDIVPADTIDLSSTPKSPDSAKVEDEILPGKKFPREQSDDIDIIALSGAEADTMQATPEVPAPSVYSERAFISKGAADEIKNISDIFVAHHGTVGSPQVPVEYLNTPGIEVTVNGQPFIYNGIYRPYLIGTDLNVIPWEILNDAYWNDPFTPNDRIDFSLGRPPDKENRSDVEVDRGPYDYQGARWRFFRPLDRQTYIYFTVGFKKSTGFFYNSDYDAYHVAGGISKSVWGGILDVDLWKHRAKSGLRSFDLWVEQLSRQSRGINRTEVRYKRNVGSLFDINLTGLYHKSKQTTKGYTTELNTRNDIGGGEVYISDSLSSSVIDLGARFYQLRLYGLAGRVPSTNIFEYFGRATGRLDRFEYRFEITYAWNGVDHGALLPAATFSYKSSSSFVPFVSLAKWRRLPDQYLLFFDDEVSGFSVSGLLESYRFESNDRLAAPVSTKASIGFESQFWEIESMVSISLKRIEDQIYLSYQVDNPGEYNVRPVNFDDEFVEVSAVMEKDAGPFSAEAGASYRRWSERFFSDGLEKGPAVLGFGRLSFLRQFFLRDLYLGGSLELRASSRRDYRSIGIGFTDAFTVFSGRLEFHYKDFTFWLFDENMTNLEYYTWWPYPEGARTVWWGFRWKFYD